MPADDDSTALDPDPRSTRGLLVIAFCAAWCNTCDDFRKTFSGLAAGRDAARFVWLDIEDDADLVGDIDIENFPTIAVFADDRLLHFGVSLPQGTLIARLLDSLDETSPPIAGAAALTGLPQRLLATHRAQSPARA